nr:DAK2 domain-containing protein [Paenibacillus senegalensis]
MMTMGAARLESQVEQVNALNVFPVPDGDTGTNMNLTMSSGIDELHRKPSEHLGKTAMALSKGLLMGARGNSGVILSQLFRGFAKSVQEENAIHPQQFAAALQQGVDTAYQAVVKPVEGTVLTVARESAKEATSYARKAGDIADLLEHTLRKAEEVLARTPDMLPVLKQVGVVDAGGRGLVLIYEGMLQALTGEQPPLPVAETAKPAAIPQQSLHDMVSAQAHMATEDIEFGYCTEFMVKLSPDKVPGLQFDEGDFRHELEKFGDSLLVVSDEDLVKVHIHAEYPGEVMNYAMKFGDLTRIKIENMREQHEHIIQAEEAGRANAYLHAPAIQEQPAVPEEQEVELKRFGFVTVSVGDGISEIFSSLGVDQVIAGGQTMNPSTEDIVKAIMKTPADTVYVLPNNSNIVMAAEQARELVEEKQVIVIPSKTIPQGMAALLAFVDNATSESNTDAMTAALQNVRSGQITQAVRDSSIDGMDIKENDYLGLMDGRIAVAIPDLSAACQQLLDQMIGEDGEIVTILAGEEAVAEQTAAIEAYLAEHHPNVEVEVHSGGQPLYVYLFSVE